MGGRGHAWLYSSCRTLLPSGKPQSVGRHVRADDGVVSVLLKPSVNPRANLTLAFIVLRQCTILSSSLSWWGHLRLFLHISFRLVRPDLKTIWSRMNGLVSYHTWPHQVISDHTRSHLATPGHTWPYQVTRPPGHVATPGHIWPYQVTRGHTRSHYSQYEHVWIATTTVYLLVLTLKKAMKAYTRSKSNKKILYIFMCIYNKKKKSYGRGSRKIFFMSIWCEG